MFDIGWLELLIIGIVALIVVGPKDLPGMFRTVGQFMGKARAMAREFQRTMEAAADETGLKEATKGLQTMADPMKSVKSSVKDFSKSIDPTKPDSTGSAPPNPEPPKTVSPKTETPAAAQADKAAQDAATKAAEDAVASKNA